MIGSLSVSDLRRVSPSAGALVWFSHDEFRSVGEKLDAFWQYPGEPGEHPYHALLVSGKHSNGFINCSTILAETNLCEILARQMIAHCRLDPGDVDFVVGPGNAAITISYEIARQLRARHGFTEKGDDGKPTKFGGRVRIEPGARVLIANELMTTGDGSTLQCKQGVLKHQPEARILPFAALLVKRSRDEKLADGTELRPLFSFDIANWEPEKCPYCKAGSTAIKPKVTEENWLKLTGKAA